MATVLNQWEVGPFNAGMNISMLGSEIDDNEATVLQDFLLDKPGQVYTRGTVENVVTPGTATFSGSSKTVKGMFSTNSPDGTTHLGTVSQDNSTTNLYFTALTDAGDTTGISIVLDASFPHTSDCVIDAKPALGGGVWVGTQELNATPNVGGRQCLFHWRGATKANYSTGTASTAAIPTTTITGSGTTWVGNVVPGMFLFAGGTLVGVVKSVTSNTSLELEFAAVNAGGGALTGYNFQSIRPFIMEVSKGRIKTQTTTPGVIASGTKFLSTPFDTSHVFPIYRARDNLWVGSFASASGDEGMTMNANATVAMDNELYTSRPGGFVNQADYQINPSATAGATRPGIFNTTYAGVQWFARNDGPTLVGTGDMHSRIWFSDYRNQNSLDMMSQDGDFFPVTSTSGKNTPITGIAATENALLVFKETETFAITGDSAANFALNKIWDDGCLSPASIVLYKGAVIWAGRNGIYLFDGAKVTNLVQRSMGPAYTSYLALFDPRLHRMTGGTYKDHYFLSFNSTTPGARLYQFTKNGTNAAPSPPVLVIYLPGEALSTFSALNIIGTAKVGQSTYYTTGSAGWVGDFAQLFTDNGSAHDFPGSGAPFTPDPLFESKWFSMKDPLRKKVFKQVMATFATLNQAVSLEVSPGVVDDNFTTWTLNTNTFIANSGTPYTSRLKFLKRDRHIRIKMYQTNVSGCGDLSLRRFAIAFKLQKIGRL